MSKSFSTLAEIVPDSIGGDAQVKHCITVIDPWLKVMANATETPAVYYRIAQLDGAQLDHMAVQFDIATWRSDWPEETKRKILLSNYRLKRMMGSVAAVKMALASMGVTLKLTEWWQTSPKGTPHTFTVTAVASGSGSGSLNKDEQQDLISMLDESKPFRSHYKLAIVSALRANMTASANFRHVVYGRVSNF